MAAERGVSQAVLTDQLRDAVDELAIEYEDVAFASIGESKQERVRAVRARQNGRRPSSMSGPASIRLS